MWWVLGQQVLGHGGTEERLRRTGCILDRLLRSEREGRPTEQQRIITFKLHVNSLCFFLLFYNSR